MATITDIVNEFKTVETAYAGTHGFRFDYPSAINNEDRQLPFPRVLLSANIDHDTGAVQVKKDKVVYKTRLFFYDTYVEDEKDNTLLQTKYGNLEQIALKYLRKIWLRRQDNSHSGWTIDNFDSLQGFFAIRKHADQLVQITYDITFSAHVGCDTGTFNNLS